jgi:hypothetical protein
MTVIMNDEISDGEFDIVGSADAVSDLSVPADETSQPQLLPGGHYGRAFDGGQLSDLGVQTGPVSDTRSSPYDDDTGNHGGDGISTLRYAKSVVQKFWTGQDLLIAVMGYETNIF